MNRKIIKTVCRAPDLLRERAPLVHNITNLVVMNSSANILLALGAFPVMAHAENEVADMAALADALVLNIGTLTDDWVRSMILAGRAANQKGIPVVLDPVGAGATPLRTRVAREILLEVDVSILRGNASEINALAGAGSGARGVDAVHGVDDVAPAAAKFARDNRIIVFVSGETDLVTDGARNIRIRGGDPMMPMITGMGCGLSAVTAALSAAVEDPLDASVSAAAIFAAAGEKATRNSSGPGSFEISFRDALYGICGADLTTIEIKEER